MSIKQLKDLAVKRGCDISMCVEKPDLRRALLSDLVENMSIDELKSSLFELKSHHPNIDDSSLEDFFTMLSEVSDKGILVSKLLFEYV